MWSQKHESKQRVSLILNCFSLRDPKLLMRAFVTCVWPVVEYATSVWSHATVGLIYLLESVQRRFTKCLHGCVIVTALYCVSRSEEITLWFGLTNSESFTVIYRE